MAGGMKKLKRRLAALEERSSELDRLEERFGELQWRLTNLADATQRALKTVSDSDAERRTIRRLRTPGS